jgi:hypothetical protein
MFGKNSNMIDYNEAAKREAYSPVEYDFEAEAFWTNVAKVLAFATPVVIGFVIGALWAL